MKSTPTTQSNTGLKISVETARRLAVTKQHLANPQPHPTPEGMLSLIRDLGCVQLDPISAVARSHQLVLWSRLGPYDLEDLDTLLWRDRSLFEYWAHAASIVLTEDYPIHRYMMRRYKTGGSGWASRVSDWIEKNADLRDAVLTQLEEKGPLLSRQVEDIATQTWKSSGWTNDRNVNRMLDFLWTQGVIMVAARAGGQKMWDLAERCLPDWTPREELSQNEIVRYSAAKAIKALGVATSRQIVQHYTRGRYPGLAGVLTELEKGGDIRRVEVLPEASAKPLPGPYFIHADDIPLLEKLEMGDEWEPRTTLLSPFDNLICDRKRTETLFNYSFRIEIYVPPPKREFGYYVLSILHGDRLIGRIDPQMDRKRGVLNINAVFAEPDAPDGSEVVAGISDAISSLAQFLGAKEIAYGERIPEAWRAITG